MNELINLKWSEWIMLAAPASFCITLLLCIISERAAKWGLIDSDYRISLVWFIPVANGIFLIFLFLKYNYLRIVRRTFTKKSTFFFAVIFCQVVYSQPTNFTSSHHWKSQRKEIFFGTGGLSLLGDLGGLNRTGTDFSVVDLEPSLTRINLHLGYRYRFKPWLQTKSRLQYGTLRGDDFLTKEPYRHYRNLSVKTHLIEFSQQLEFIFYSQEQFGKRYNISRVRGTRHKNTLLYFSSGFSFLVFIPKGFYNGKWYKLRPLRTEGQGLPEGPEPYKPFTLGIPVGLGLKLGIDALWRLSFEFSYTKTFTDYLDDVSTNYYDNNSIKKEYGPIAGYFADPSSGEFPTWTHPGQMRGDPDENDAYLFLNVSLIRNITYARTKKMNFQHKARF